MATLVAAQPSPKPVAIPLDPVQAILDSCRTRSIVCHWQRGVPGDEQSYAFSQSLIRDPRLNAFAQDIVVEFGNARDQSVMDRFIAGESIPGRISEESDRT